MSELAFLEEDLAETNLNLSNILIETGIIRRRLAQLAIILYIGIFVIMAATIAIILTSCGSPSGSSPTANPPPHTNYPTVINCDGCPDPAPATYLWAANSNIYLMIDGITPDNTNMQAFADADQITVCLRQWQNGAFKRVSCYDQTGIKPGSYDNTYFVWTGLGEFCPGDKWCAAQGIAYLELYIDDGIAPWHAYAIPDALPPGSPTLDPTAGK